jgi:hypothetical protein
MGTFFYKNISALICFLCAVTLCFPVMVSAESDEGELFEKAYRDYLSGDFGKAIEIFDLLLKMYPDSSAADAFLFYKAGSLLQLGKKTEADPDFRKLIRMYPESPYVSFAEKELDSLNKPDINTAPPGTGQADEKQTSALSDRMMSGYIERIRKLEAENSGITGNLLELEKRLQLARKDLAKAVEERDALELQHGEALKEQSARYDQDRLLEVRLKQCEAQTQVLSAKETGHLDKYREISSVFSARFSSAPVTEKELMDIYEKHRRLYFKELQERVLALSIGYSPGDELEKGLMAIEIRQEALDGSSFAEIAGSRPGTVKLREMSLSGLPDWVRKKTLDIEDGGLGDIMAAENEFLLIRRIQSRPVFRSFEDVKKDMEKELSAERESRRSFEQWLDSRRGELPAER